MAAVNTADENADENVVAVLAGNVGNMLATCQRQVTMLPIFAPTSQFWRHVSCVLVLVPVLAKAPY